ncbi:hypothetical protein [Mollivirus kamchatka]|nr:hypothetical protein [Mollivirus kamchatka]
MATFRLSLFCTATIILGALGMAGAELSSSSSSCPEITRVFATVLQCEADGYTVDKLAKEICKNSNASRIPPEYVAILAMAVDIRCHDEECTLAYLERLLFAVQSEGLVQVPYRQTRRATLDGQ